MKSHVIQIEKYGFQEYWCKIWWCLHKNYIVSV